MLLEKDFVSNYKDFFVFSRLLGKYRYTRMQRMVVPILFFIYFFVLFAFSGPVIQFITQELQPYLEPNVTIMLVPCIYFLVFLALYILTTRKLLVAISARWIEKSKPAPVLHFEADEKTLKWETKDGGAYIYWSAVERIFVAPQGMCFLVGALGHYLPRRVFNDEAEFTDFLKKSIALLPDAARALTLQDKRVAKQLAN